MRRSLPAYAALLCATILLGLATRTWPTAFPDLIARYGGDVLWAAMVVWVLALLRPAATPRSIGLLALTIAVLVELSQLHQAPWIVAVRGTRVGALALGQGFLWSDLLCYAVGVALAVLIDALMVRHARSRTAA